MFLWPKLLIFGWSLYVARKKETRRKVTHMWLENNSNKLLMLIQRGAMSVMVVRCFMNKCHVEIKER